MNDNNPHFTIELIGSYAARHVESGIENDQSNRRNAGTTRSPIPPLCRDLIAMGHGPEAKTTVVRRRADGSFITVLKGNRTLGRWAELDCVESEKLSVRIGRFNPPTMAAALQAVREEDRVAA